MSSQFKILNAGNMTLTLHSDVVDLSAVNLGSIHAVYVGAPSGSLYLEISNDIIAPTADPNAAVINYTQYGGAVAIAAPGNFMFNISNMGYKWVRLTYVPSGGNGTLDATVMEKNA